MGKLPKKRRKFLKSRPREPTAQRKACWRLVVGEIHNHRRFRCPWKASLLSVPAVWPALGGGSVGILGPSVFGIPAPEIFSHLVVGGLPEARQIVGDLLRTHVGGQQVEQDGDASTGDARGPETVERLAAGDRRLPFGGRGQPEQDAFPLAGHEFQRSLGLLVGLDKGHELLQVQMYCESDSAFHDDSCIFRRFLSQCGPHFLETVLHPRQDRQRLGLSQRLKNPGRLTVTPIFRDR